MNLKEGTWAIAFSPDGTRLYIGDFDGRIFVYDVKLKKMFSRIFDLNPIERGKLDRRVHAIATHPKFNLVAAYVGSRITIWSIDNLSPLLHFSVFSASEYIEQRLTPGGRGDISFDPSGALLIGGFEDKSIRFWDARPFIPNTEGVGSSEEVPDWWQKTKPAVPKGMRPNPSFGESLRVIEQKLSCKGLRIAEAKGLNSNLSADQKIFMEKGINTLGQWLVARGAVETDSRKPTRKRLYKKPKESA